MKSHFRKRTGIMLAAACGVALVASLVAPRASADSWDKTTFLTLSEPTQVMNTYLEPGTYMFKLANTDRHIVQIFNSDRSHLINTIIAIPNYRVNVTDRAVFTFWETPPGTAKAVRAWFYPGDHYGQEFTYPTDLRQIAAVTPLQAPAPVVPPPPPAVSTPVPAPEPQAEEVTPPAPQPEAAAPPQEPVEIAQAAPPPPPPEPAAQQPAQSQSSSQASDSALPQTASPYPLIGLCGLVCLALFLGLRAKQSR